MATTAKRAKDRKLEEAQPRRSRRPEAALLQAPQPLLALRQAARFSAQVRHLPVCVSANWR